MSMANEEGWYIGTTARPLQLEFRAPDLARGKILMTQARPSKVRFWRKAAWRGAAPRLQ
jgi:hypothetical protein